MDFFLAPGSTLGEQRDDLAVFHYLHLFSR